MINKKIYLDYAAMTPIDSEVLEKMQDYYSFDFGNPSSMYRSGRLAKAEIFKARKIIAQNINARPEEIIFTGSGTESDNLAIFGVAQKYKDKGKHVMVSSIEHKAVMESVKKLEKEGFEVTYLKVNREGEIDLEDLKKEIREDTILVSIIYVNNEIGTIQNISKIFNEIKKDNLPILHTDACQAVGHLDIDVNDLGADLISMNSSKIYGPKGIGILYKKNSINIESLIIGGDQEFKLRAGTESLPQIMGCAFAFEKSCNLLHQEVQKNKKLRTCLIDKIGKEIPEVIINGQIENGIDHVLHITIPDIEGESIVLMLDQYGIEVATGSACSSNDLKPSYVLSAIGQNDDLVHGSIRISFGRETEIKDLDYLVEKLKIVTERLKSMSALTIKKYERK